MSIFDAMMTSVSGMNAQANKVSTYSENIANSNTVGYKAASAQFETMLIDEPGGSYTSGGVNTVIRYGIDQQGVPTGTSSPTDLAINGQGFFVVSDTNGNPHLTRAGSFVPDASGYLVNSAGFRLMGVQAAGAANSTSTTGFGGLSEIKIDMSSLVASASTTGTSRRICRPARPPSRPATCRQRIRRRRRRPRRSSLVAYDNLGDKVMLDVYLTKTGANDWEAAVFDASQASASGGFPYGSGPLTASDLQFDATSGRLIFAVVRRLSIAVPGGKTMALDIGGVTQLGAALLGIASDGRRQRT